MSWGRIAIALALSASCHVDAQNAAPRADPRPEAMRRAEAARSAAVMQTGQVEFVVTETLNGRRVARVMTWRFAGPDMILVDHGDEFGVVVRDPNGARQDIDYNTPQNYLLQEGRVWVHGDRDPTASVFPEAKYSVAELYDPRQLGLTPYRTRDTLESVVAKDNLPPLQWESAPEGDLTRVTARSGDSSISWILDPGLDWNPVRRISRSGEIVTGEVEISYQQRDGVWYPTRVESFYTEGGVRKRGMLIDVAYAAFNRPDQPGHLAPGDIGIEVGTNINFRDQSPSKYLIWDGQQGETSAQFSQRVSRGELEPGPTIARETARLNVVNERRGDFERYQRERAAAGLLAEPMPRSLSEWERYTLDFIQRHKLDDGQRERALAILKDCADEGNAHINRHKFEFDAYDERLSRATRTLDMDASHWLELADARSRLLEPLDRIFEERLKPRLDALLTREQRERAKPPVPASRPGA